MVLHAMCCSSVIEDEKKPEDAPQYEVEKSRRVQRMNRKKRMLTIRYFLEFAIRRVGTE